MLAHEPTAQRYPGDDGCGSGYQLYPPWPPSLRNFVTVLFKRKSIILLLFVSVAGIVTLGTLLLPPVFKSEAKILVEREVDAEKMLLFRMNLQVSTEQFDWVKSEVEILKSYPVTIRVIRALQLYERNLDKQTMKEQERALRFERTVKNFQKTLKVESAKNSNVIDVSYEEKQPRLAAAVVNKVIETYMQYRSEIFNESETYKFFQRQMQIADKQLRDLEARESEFKRSRQIVSPQAQTDILLAKLSDYQRTLTDARTRRIGKEARLKIIREQFDSGNDLNIPTTESSDSPSREKFIGKLKGELLDMQIRRDRLLQKFTPEYEEVVNLNNQIKATRQNIRTEIQQIIDEEETAIRVLQAQEEVFAASIAAINGEIKSFTEKKYQLAQLTRGIDDNKEVYSMLLKQREEARISLGKLQRGVNVRIISPAIVSTDKAKPLTALNIVLGIVLGLLSGLGMAFIVEYFDHSVNSPEEVERYLGLPVLGSIREFQQATTGGKPRRHGEKELSG